MLKGESTFLNKHGYLSADRRPLQQFYGAMGLLYLLMGIFWGLMMACNHKDLLTLQYWVGFVLILCMLEMAFSWGDLFVWNDGGADGGLGARSRGLLVFAKLLSAVKNTLSRLLVLVTAMGLSVVKPRLGDVKKQITAVGVCSLAMFGIYGVVYVKRTKTPQKKVLPHRHLQCIRGPFRCWRLPQPSRTQRNRVRWRPTISIISSYLFAVLYADNWMQLFLTTL